MKHTHTHTHVCCTFDKSALVGINKTTMSSLTAAMAGAIPVHQSNMVIVAFKRLPTIRVDDGIIRLLSPSTPPPPQWLLPPGFHRPNRLLIYL